MSEIRRDIQETKNDKQLSACELTHWLTRRFSLEKFAEFDQEFFEEAVSQLTQEFEKNESAHQRSLLLNRYFDAFFPHEKTPYSQLFERFAMKPLTLFNEALRLQAENKEGGNANVIDPKDNFSLLKRPEIKQYGPSTLYQCFPSSYIQTSLLSPQDVIASSHFSCCRAVVGVNTKGEGLLSHIPTSWREDDLLKRLREKFGTGKLWYIYPYEELNSEATTQEVERREKDTQRYETMAKQIGLIPLRYQEVSARDHALNPYNIDSTTIMVCQSGIQVVGVRESYNQKPIGRYDVRGVGRHVTPVEETRIDIPFI